MDKSQQIINQWKSIEEHSAKPLAPLHYRLEILACSTPDHPQHVVGTLLSIEDVSLTEFIIAQKTIQDTFLYPEAHDGCHFTWYPDEQEQCIGGLLQCLNELSYGLENHLLPRPILSGNAQELFLQLQTIESTNRKNQTYQALSQQLPNTWIKKNIAKV